MRVVEKKSIPIYETECPECQSKLQYKACEVSLCHITCPICGISLWANTCCPVAYQSSGMIMCKDCEYWNQTPDDPEFPISKKEDMKYCAIWKQNMFADSYCSEGNYKKDIKKI